LGEPERSGGSDRLEVVRLVGADALVERGTIEQILERSADFPAEREVRLRDRIYFEAVPGLLPLRVVCDHVRFCKSGRFPPATHRAGQSSLNSEDPAKYRRHPSHEVLVTDRSPSTQFAWSVTDRTWHMAPRPFAHGWIKGRTASNQGRSCNGKGLVGEPTTFQSQRSAASAGTSRPPNPWVSFPVRE